MRAQLAGTHPEEVQVNVCVAAGQGIVGQELFGRV